MLMNIMSAGPKQLVAVFFTAKLWSKVVNGAVLHVFSRCRDNLTEH